MLSSLAQLGIFFPTNAYTVQLTVVHSCIWKQKLDRPQIRKMWTYAFAKHKVPLFQVQRVYVLQLTTVEYWFMFSIKRLPGNSALGAIDWQYLSHWATWGVMVSVCFYSDWVPDSSCSFSPLRGRWGLCPELQMMWLGKSALLYKHCFIFNCNILVFCIYIVLPVIVLLCF